MMVHLLCDKQCYAHKGQPWVDNFFVRREGHNKEGRVLAARD
jgi:hypothetical protein